MFSAEPRRQHLATTLLASAARTVTGNGGADGVRIPDAPNGIAFALDVTAAATEAADTLDVLVQTKVDGTNWLDVVAFTQVTGDGGTKRHIAKVAAGLAEAMFENGSALSAGSVRDIIGDEWRVRWAITDASTDNASFTFSVTACPM